MKNKINEDLNEMRTYLSKCISEKRNILRESGAYHDQYFLQLKSWCVTLFMVSTGFCLKEKSNIGSVFYFLPIVPVLLFWFLHAYREFRITIYLKHPEINKLDECSQNLFKYFSSDLNNKIKEIVEIKFDWKDKGKFKICRFFNEKLCGILRKSFGNLENLAFFGGMIIFWLIIILFQIYCF